MAYKLQVSDLKATTIKNIAGMCLDSQAFLDVVNEVQRRLMRRGNWFDTEWLMKVCAYDGCIAWPRFVGTVLGARFCDGAIGESKNRWYNILGGAHTLNPSDGLYDLVLSDMGCGPTYNQIRGTAGQRVRYYVSYQNDIGKTIKIYGKKYGGQPLQELDANGNYVDGITLTAAAPYVNSTVDITHITSIVRQATQGMAYLFAYDSTDPTETLRDLAMYEPGETNPSYRKSLIRNYCCAPACTETTTVSGTDYLRNKVSIEALVKLEVFPVTTENDFLLIDNYEAFKFGFQAVKLEEANDDKAAEAKWIKAIRELNFQDRDKNPPQSTTVKVNVVNGYRIYSPY